MLISHPMRLRAGAQGRMERVKVMVKILAIDGGTYHTGYAFFDDNHLIYADVVSPPENWLSYERIANIIESIKHLLRDADVLVWESWRGPRNPELQVLLRCLRQLAKMYNCEPVEIHASSVVKAISLDGKGRQRREARKLAIREGVAYHYPEYQDTQQDIQDAIAIGWCYLHV